MRSLGKPGLLLLQLLGGGRAGDAPGLSRVPLVLLGATETKAFQGFPSRTVTIPLFKVTAYFV